MSKKVAPDVKAPVESANGSTKEKDKDYEESVAYRKSIEYFATFTPCPNIIRYNKNLSWDEKQILWAIYLHTLDPKELPFNWDSCRPSQSTLADFCNRARSRIRPFIDSLIRKGYVKEKKQFEGKQRKPSKFFLTGLLSSELLEHENLVRNDKRDELPDLKKFISKRIKQKKLGVVSNETRDLSQMRQGGLSQMGQELDSNPELDLKFELESNGTHTRKKKVLKKETWKKKGEGVSFSISAECEKIPPTPLKNKTVKNSVISIGDAKRKRKGEKDMGWEKKGKKGGFRSNGGVDNTEGLAISKTSQTHRKSEPENGKVKETKWTRLVNEVQTIFKQKAMTHQGGVLSSGGQHRQLASMVKNLGGLAQTKAVIEYAIEHWDELRARDKKLLSEPNLNNMLVDWRYLEWKDMMKLEGQRVELPKALREESTMKRAKITLVK